MAKIEMSFVRETLNYAIYEGPLPDGQIWFCYFPKPTVTGKDVQIFWPSKRVVYTGRRGFSLIEPPLPCPPATPPHKSASRRSQYNKSRSARAKRANLIKKAKAKFK